ncbi:iron dicitrate transport regulator FecR [Bordetella genomosp. 5]|uniref:FecR domain-containing protein n=1 Tax=Bordetella genomosp. 5 TaxID=1395608 RepID=UPI000B9E9A4F|nr:FecR domain-containing protein [Bordetella genomosp. 5]OZI46305.1 iron dicitrate transport regulator FecR [Bordetella genomosp. 5]
MEQAADWYALLRSGEASAQDHAAWRLWLEGAAEHQQAWHYVERIGMRFAPLQASADRDAAVAAYRRASAGGGRTRRQVVLGLFGAIGAGWLGWASWRHTPLPALAAGWGADHRAGIGETRQISLPDGTRVWLRALSAFNVDYGASLRRLELVEGEMLIDTAPDAARPFVVDTGAGRLQALGTRFTVRQEHDAVLVAVFDGAVRVAPSRGGATGVVSAGEQAYFGEDGLRPRVAANPGHEAWTRGVLVADGLTLGEVVGELRRYHLGHLGLAPEIAHLRVFGSFPIDDVPRALAMLASVMPIRVRQPLAFWISVDARA